MASLSVHLVRQLFPEHVAVAEMDPRLADPAWLLPEEAQYVAKAVDKRRREFAAGRRLARRAMAVLGCPSDAPLLPDDKRAPVWPEGVTGTISHTDRWAACAVGRAGEVGEIGVDVEKADPLKEALWTRICREEERDFLLSQPESFRGVCGKLIFSAKECAYKAQFPRSRKILPFEAMTIAVALDAGTFRAEFCQDAPPYRVGHRFEGVFRLVDGLIATAVVTASGPPRTREPY